MKKLTSKHNVLQEEDGGLGKCMINRSLRVVMN
ncbi:helicase subunit [Escherichia coli]|uniref:Helicase subunit n=1 Tax=Salmonella enterica subsp. enterica serovar Typhi str. CT18 TaxID=220341 RepID=A0A717A434_SALTI|nr:helicase subunit [Salmonella enterica subsp. enterica serovar Typhimurium]EEW2750460.1 helicase subunit [Escherichia coli]EHK3035803.1 helicase subunit [Escherichia fergusonii]HAD4838319.1 helicase subunit [Salmonella enterica subsp. enterica serovar Typhi str. CT18]EEW5978514.1 helicase subunit [Escherichia coli]